MPENVDWILWPLLCIAAFYYLVAPLLIRFQQRYPAHPDLKTLDFAAIEPEDERFLLTQTGTLVELGFDEPTLVHVANAAPNVTIYLIMLVNRQSGDKAMVTVIIGTGLVRLQTNYLEFSTRFDSGEVFNTHNTSELNAFRPSPHTVRTQVPTLRDPEDLYHLHTYIMGKHLPAGRPVLYEPGGALDYLIEYAFVKTYDVQVQRGWLYYDQSRDLYRLTLKGAYLITLGLLQPFKGIRQAMLQRREKRVLDEFETASGPALRRST